MLFVEGSLERTKYEASKCLNDRWKSHERRYYEEANETRQARATLLITNSITASLNSLEGVGGHVIHPRPQRSFRRIRGHDSIGQLCTQGKNKLTSFFPQNVPALGNEGRQGKHRSLQINYEQVQNICSLMLCSPLWARHPSLHTKRNSILILSLLSLVYLLYSHRIVTSCITNIFL